MPLLDHFHPPLSRTHQWKSFHGMWAAAIARQLNGGILPEGFYAVPFCDSDGPIEIDVAALVGTAVLTPSGPGGWTPAAPAMTVTIDPLAPDGPRVDVLTDDGDPRLKAAIELVSPANKDRPATREAFAGKCAGYLSRGAGLAVVDLITNRRADLHAALLTALGADSKGPAVPSAVAYRAANRGDRVELLAWPVALAVGQPLPTLPLWLAPDVVVPLDLEASYMATCADLRIRQAG